MDALDLMKLAEEATPEELDSLIEMVNQSEKPLSSQDVKILVEEQI